MKCPCIKVANRLRVGSIERHHDGCKARNLDFTFDVEEACGIKLETTSSAVTAKATATTTASETSSAATETTETETTKTALLKNALGGIAHHC